MRILITGGSGFIGTNLVERCVARGLPVINLDIAPPRNKQHTGVWSQLDVTDLPALTVAIENFRPTHVAHLAARTDLDETRSIEGYRANTDGVANLIRVCESEHSLQRVLFSSSMLVCRYGYRPRQDTDYCPTTLYGKSKVIGEQAVRNSAALNGRWVLIRPTSIWGPWFGPPFRDLFLAIARGRYWHPGSSKIPMALGYVGNTVDQILKLLEAPDPCVCGKTFYLADDPPITLREWTEAIQREFAQQLGAKPIREVPLWLLKSCARLGDVGAALRLKNVPLTTFRLQNILTESGFDLNELMAITGPPPLALPEGVSRTVEWLQASNGLN